MTSNNHLIKAKEIKNDEFYTPYKIVADELDNDIYIYKGVMQ